VLISTTKQFLDQTNTQLLVATTIVEEMLLKQGAIVGWS